MIQNAGTSPGYSGQAGSAYFSLFCLSRPIGRSVCEGSSSPLLKPGRACIVPCAPVQGSWSMLPGALWQKSYFRFSLLFLLIIHAAVFQHFVTISTSFTGGWVFTASSYKLGTWNMGKRRAFFMELLGYWCFKLSTIWYPGNRWQSWPVNLRLCIQSIR